MKAKKHILLFMVLISIPLLFGSCATTKISKNGYFGGKGQQTTTFTERVFKKFKRKPMSQRKKYQRPMRKWCKATYNERSVYVLQNRSGLKETTPRFKNSDCAIFTYDIK